MATRSYIGVTGVARAVKKGYIGIDGVARRIKKAYIGIGGVARPCWSGGDDLDYYGAFFDNLEQMVDMYTKQGCDFSSCETAEDKLAAIKAFEDAREAEQAAQAKAQSETMAANEELTATSLASIAASMEHQNLLTLDDMEA